MATSPPGSPQPPHDGTPQDAHLHAALRHAPDAQDEAPPALSQAILQAARDQAARQAPPPAGRARAAAGPSPWWKRLAAALRPPASPGWAAGLAAAFVAVFAGLIWLPSRPDADFMPPRPAAPTPRDGAANEGKPAVGSMRQDAAKDAGEAPAGAAPASTAGQTLRKAAPVARSAPPVEERPAPAPRPEREAAPAQDRQPQPLHKPKAPALRPAPPPAEKMETRSEPALQPPPAPAVAAPAAAPVPEPIPGPAAPAPAPSPALTTPPPAQATDAVRAAARARGPSSAAQPAAPMYEGTAAQASRGPAQADDRLPGKLKDKKRETTPEATGSSRFAASPLYALQLRLAASALPASGPARFLAERDDGIQSARLSPALRWQLPGGRPRAIDAQAQAWLVRLEAAAGEWRRVDGPPREAAWSLQWQDSRDGVALGKLLLAEGQAWLRDGDGRWWQAALPEHEVAVLKHDAQELLAPTAGDEADRHR